MKEDVEELLKVADDDLEAAKELLKLGKYRILAFHAQQAVEKYLKAYLLEKKGNYPFTHSIAFLIKSCIEVDRDFEYLYDIGAQELTKYYTVTRYLPLMHVPEEEARKALEIAEKVRGFVLKKLREQP